MALDRTVNIDRVSAPVSSAAPSISGIAQDGRTLRGEIGTWDGQGLEPAYSYRWLRCAADGTGCTPTGAVGTSYDVTAEDGGYAMVFEVTATTSEGATVAVSSPTAAVRDRTGAVVAPPGPAGAAGGAGGAGAAGQSGLPGAALPAGDERCSGAAIVLADVKAAAARTRGRSAFTLGGRFVAAGGAPTARQPLDVVQTIRGRAARVIGIATTADDGSFAFQVPAGPSRTLRITARTCAVTSAAMAQSVRGQIRFKAVQRTVGNTGLARFRGQVRGGYVSPGVNLTLQGLKPGTKSWVNLKPLRSDAKGRFRTSWRFRPARAYRYSFRVVVRDSGWPYAAGSPSAVARVGTRSR